jgi:hypothetical protein
MAVSPKIAAKMGRNAEIPNSLLQVGEKCHVILLAE